MSLNITKENYQTFVWDEDIPSDDYYKLYGSLDFEEKVAFLKFILEKYPDFDKDWVEYFFNISDKWEQEAQWDKLAEFADFVREKCPKVYQQKSFIYLERSPVMYALFHNDLETAKIRFAESVAQPEAAIDDSLRTVFNLLSTNINFKEYTKEVAEKVWLPLHDSEKLMGNAEFDYSAYLYCDFLEKIFDKIQIGETVDWEDFTQKIESINFKMVAELPLLPGLQINIEQEEFHKNEAYRNERLNSMLVPFLYNAHTELGIPVYWAFRTWFDWRKYLLDSENAPRRANWFAYTPKMLDRMGGTLIGFIGENKTGMINVSMTLPYLYDFLLKQNYIEESLHSQLMEYYDFFRREILKLANQDLWKYKGLYTWKKPQFLSEERFKQEEAVMLDAINWRYEDSRKQLSAYTEGLPTLPQSAAPPPPEPSPWGKMMAGVGNKPAPINAPIVKRRISRPKKKRKKKHKDNRKQGNKKKKR